jgi:hypothetical protein
MEVFGAAVPEASIDENRDPWLAENRISGATQIQSWPCARNESDMYATQEFVKR